MDEGGRELRLRLRRRQRIISGRVYSQVYAQRRSVADSAVVVYARTNGLSYSRLGLSVGRKHGNAVRRNRIRRLLREAFRLGQHDIPAGYDYVLIPREGFGDSLAECRRSVLKLTRRAAQLAGEQVGDEGQ